MNEREREISCFFEEVEAVGVLLPGRWFGGRPMENQHRLTFVADRSRRLILELDDVLLLSIVGSCTLRHTVTDQLFKEGTRALVISGFDQAVLEFVDSVDGTPHLESFQEGEIVLVAAL